MLITLRLNYVLMDPQSQPGLQRSNTTQRPQSLQTGRKTFTHFTFSFKHKQDLSNLKWDSSIIKKCLTRDKKLRLCPITMHSLFFLPYFHLTLWDIWDRLNPHLFLAFLLTSEKMQWIIKGFMLQCFVMACVISTDPIKEALEDENSKYLMFFCLWKV